MASLPYKILALDVGTKRVGFAIGDIYQKMAFPRSFLAKIPQQTLFESIKKIVQEEEIKKIIIGVPLDAENLDTTSSTTIRKFGAKLERFLNIPIEYVDEFGSTDEALAKIPFRADRQKKKGVADAIAAQIILQRYLDLLKK